MILHTVTAAEEYHDLFVQVLLQEGEQQQQTLVSRHNHVALLQPLTSGCGAGVIYTNIQRLVLERQTSQVLNLWTQQLHRRRQNSSENVDRLSRTWAISAPSKQQPLNYYT